MVYDPKLAARIRKLLSTRKNVTEKEMFGGLHFLLHGRLCVAVVSDDLMVRVGPEARKKALAKPHVRPWDLTKHPMKGFLFVAPAGAETDKALAGWVNLAADFAATLKK